MKHHRMILSVMLIGLTLSTGCRGGGMHVPPGSSLLEKMSDKKAGKSKEKEEGLADDVKNDKETISPVKNGESEPTKEDNPFIANMKKNSPAAKDASAVEKTASSTRTVHDPKTMMLIETELRSLPAEQRAEWIKLLREVPSEQVPQILAVMQMNKKAAQPATAPTATTPNVAQNSDPNEIMKRMQALSKQNNGLQTQPASMTQPVSNNGTGGFENYGNSNNQPFGQNQPTNQNSIPNHVQGQQPFGQQFNAQMPTVQPTSFQGLGNVSPWGSKNAPTQSMQLMGIEAVADNEPLTQPQAPNIAGLNSNQLPSVSAGWNPNDNPLYRQANQNPNIQQMSGQNPQAGMMATNQPQDLSKLNANGQSFSTAFNPNMNHGGANPNGTQNALFQPQNNNSEMWKTELQKLISVAEAEFSQQKPGATEDEKLDYVAKQVYLRMMYLMGGQQSRALQAIDNLDAADQEFWQQIFWAMANYFDKKGIPQEADRASQSISQLQSAIQRLQTKAQLEIRNVNFCHKITSFGNYDRFDRDEFQPGQPILIYAELHNFSSEPTADGQYRTVLKSTVEIHKAGAQGGLVTQNEFPPTEDLCRNRRQDYFHSYLTNVPDRATIGPHILKLTVEDQISHKIATYTMNFNVK